MELILSKKPKNPIVIQGFPGLGLIGTIVTEFLIEHLNMKQIGSIKLDEITPLIAIHEEEVVYPVGIYYDEKTNIVVIHVVANLKGVEWKLADLLSKLTNDLLAKEIITLEGVGSNVSKEECSVFFVSQNKSSKEKLSKIIKPLQEGIIVGVSAAMLVDKSIKNMTGLFAETHTNLPDSKSAAKLVETLDKYLDLNVDPAPLLKQAEQFEDKLKKIVLESQKTQDITESKQMSYLG